MTFTRSVDLPASAAEAFELITQPQRLRRWQAVSASVELRAGGGYRWTVVPGQVAAGTYREIEPGRRVVFGWGWEGNSVLPPDASTVTVTIEQHGEGSRVTLVHEGLDAEQEALHAEGWNHYLDRLERLAATGDAGPDEWEALPERLDPVVASDAALAALQEVLLGLTPEHADRPTPCADYTCRELVDHLIGSVGQLAAMAGVAVPAVEGGSIEDRVSVATAGAIDAWRARGLEGSVPGPGGREVPAAFIATILPVEIALHGWDLAQASGQKLMLRDRLVDYLHELAEGLVPGGRAGGSFGPEVEPASDASPLDRLAAYAGRRPLS